MICVFPADCTDFSTNGIGTVEPSSCTVTETLNGEWELTLTHPLDSTGKWQRLAEGRILRTPVPAGVTPQIKLVKQSTSSTLIYRVATSGSALHLRSGTGTKYKILANYKNGTQVIVLAKTTSSWYEVSCPDGKHGYMASQYLAYVRTETSVQTATDSVIQPRQLREQPFRIYRVVPELHQITVYACHVFYDLMDNMIKKYAPAANVVGTSVVAGISESCLSEHDFTFYSDLTTTAKDVLFENINPAEALLGEGGVVDQYSAELARDWFDVFLVQRVGSDTNVQIREGKNLLGIRYDVDLTNVVTRIMPTGENKDGKIVYLDSLYVDSPHLSYYPQPKWIHLPVSEAKQSDEMSLAQVKTKLKQAAQAEFDKGCDLPTITLSVDLINCADTVEYAQYAALQNIYIGDAVRVIAARIGVEVSMRMTQYTYDCLTKKYTAMTLGTVADTIEGNKISSRQLSGGIITGAKLAIDSVGAGQLVDGSVGSLQIGMAAIGTAHIQEAAITRAHIAEALVNALNADALTAVTARIQELAAAHLTADMLYAAVAQIAVAQLTSANIESADIAWAQMGTLTAAIANVAEAVITDTQISTAQIEHLSASVAEIVHQTVGVGTFALAEIQNLLANALVLHQGVADSMQIANLSVTSANILNATLDNLVLHGTDGKYYRVFVGADGAIATEEASVTADEITAGQTTDGRQITATTANVADLNATTIKASQAVISSIFAESLAAGKITAGEALIASATIPTLYVTAVNAIGENLDLSANNAIRLLVQSGDALAARMTTAEQKLTDDAIVSTVTQSEPYQSLADDVENTSQTSETAIGMAEVWIENAQAAQSLAQEARNAADSAVSNTNTLRNQIIQTANGLSIVQTKTGDLEGRMETIESGVHIEGSQIGIYTTGSPFRNTITNDGWVISESDNPIITCAETKLTAPRVQVTDALIIGGLAWKPSQDRHVRLLKYGR